MPVVEIDLNQNPLDSGLENPIDRNEIGEWDDPANELDYAMVWNDENQGDGQGADGEQDDAPEDDAPAMNDGGTEGQDDAPTVNDGGTEGVQVHAANGEQQGAPTHGSNNRKRRYYPDDLKIAIYLKLLSRTDPPRLKHGVSSFVAQKFDVPLSVVQKIWKKRKRWWNK